MIATDEGRARFWAESAEEKNGFISFSFINGMSAFGRIIDRSDPSLFVLNYFGSRVEFHLAPDRRGGTDLTLINTGYDSSDFDQILPGWLNVLLPLKAAVDFDVDLRNHDAERTWDQRFVDQ